MKQYSSTYLRRKRKALLEKLPSLYKIIGGSLIERYIRCGKPGCKCAQGQGHGPKYYLSISHYKGKTEMDYVPQDYHEQVVEYLDNFHAIKNILNEICQINRELLRRREKL